MRGSLPVEAPRGSLRSGWSDVRAGIVQWPIWWSLPIERVKANYRRTYLGMIWMTLTTVAFVVGLSLLFGVLMEQDLKTFVPYVAVGFICFTWMTGMLSGGASSVEGNSAFVKTTAGPRSAYALQVVTRPTLQFLHDAVVIAIVLIVFQVPVGGSLILLPVAVVLILINGVATAMWLGPTCARYRDVGQLVDVVIRVLFFFTPVFWVTTDIARAQLILLAGWNPLTYLLQLFRAPLLGEWPGAMSVVGAFAITFANTVVGFIVFSRTRPRWAYWL